MHNVLVACKQLSFNFDENGDLEATDSDEPKIHTLALLAAIDLLAARLIPLASDTRKSARLVAFLKMPRRLPRRRHDKACARQSCRARVKREKGVSRDIPGQVPVRVQA